MKIVNSPVTCLPDVVEYLVDERIGIIRYVKEVPREAGAPDFFHFYARACNTGAFGRQRNFADSGGASAERSVAAAKAIGEAVERYCSAIYDVEDFPLCSFESAPFQCVPPGEFALYSRQQYAGTDFPYVPFEETTPVRWAPAREPGSGDIRHVPASMVVLPYRYDPDNGELPIAQSISTGLACHRSPEEAAVSAICEVIERDAFTITWQARLGVPRIRTETLSDLNSDLVGRFESAGSAVSMFNLAMDHGVPTILSVLRAWDAGEPALVFAASTDPDPEKAARKSLEELAHTRRLAQQLTTDLPPLAAAPDYENVVNQDCHVRLYCDQANVPLADFLFASDERMDFRGIENLATGDPGRDLEILVGKVRAVNHRVLLADLTTEDVASLGLAVVRALIPGFHPLFMRHSLRALGGARLYEVPQKLGYEGITRESGDNSAPHPYP